MRPSAGVANLPAILVACFGHEIYVKAISVQTIFMAFDYSYTTYMQLNLKDNLM